MIKYEKQIDDEITYKIIGCAMKVHNTLGNGFQEAIYQRCMEIEMKKQGLNFEREFSTAIFYDNEKVGARRVDFLVEKEIIVELKAVIELLDIHLNQALNYLEAFGLEKGLLINFGAKSLEFKRLIKKIKNPPINSKKSILS
jgi:GxxExxY protein